MFKFLLGLLILASNFLVFSRAIAEMGAGSGPGVTAATAASTPFCKQATTKQIKTLSDLRNVGTTGNYCLANDIDGSPTSNSQFAPIGDDGNPFVGIFDGNGHVIDKLTIGSVNGGCCAFSGVFGSDGSAGHVRNVGITNGTISQSNGGLLAGENNGVVTNCFATGAVSSQWLAGGLIAWNKGQVTNSHATVLVQGGSGTRMGGFVGQNDTTGTIMQSYARRRIAGSGAGSR